MYREPTIVVDKPVTIVGDGCRCSTAKAHARSSSCSADDVTVRGLVLRNVGTSYVEDRAAIRVTRARGCVIEDNRIEDGFFGIYLAERRPTAASCATCCARTRRANPPPATAFISGRRSASRSPTTQISGHRDGIYFEFVHDEPRRAQRERRRISATECTSCTPTTASTCATRFGKRLRRRGHVHEARRR